MLVLLLCSAWPAAAQIPIDPLTEVRAIRFEGQHALSERKLRALLKTKDRGAAYGLRVALTWWPVGIALVAVYFTFLFRWMRGKVDVESEPSYGSAVAGLDDSPGRRV